MKHFSIKITHIPSQNSPNKTEIGTARATLNDKGQIRIKFNLNKEQINKFPDQYFRGLNKIIKNRIRTFENKYPYVWDEEDLIETYIKEK